MECVKVELGTLLILSGMAKETTMVAAVALGVVFFGFESSIFAGTKTAEENTIFFIWKKMTG
jgi:hypothetical protein